MSNGSQRIQSLILSFRNFARLDEANLKRVDIHEGIDHTLLLLSGRLAISECAAEINIIKNYGVLPEIECYAGSLNLVFLSILTNAIEALEADRASRPSLMNPLPPPQITIETKREADRALILIADNGPGMETEVAQKIFEPFFTTKPVGRGTGLSLTISAQIVIQQHQGQLDCVTAPHQGSQFIIHLPLVQRDRATSVALP